MSKRQIFIIDRLVEEMAGNKLLSFMDTFSGYNQIMMKPKDREKKNAFIMDCSMYCYNVIHLVSRVLAQPINDSWTESSPKISGKPLNLYWLYARKFFRGKIPCRTRVRIFWKTEPSKHEIKHDEFRFTMKACKFLGCIVTYRWIKVYPKPIDTLMKWLRQKQNKKCKYWPARHGTQLFHLEVNRKMFAFLWNF